MKKALILFLGIFSLGYSQNLDHSVFTELMKEYNYEGNVNYKKLKSDQRLDAYLNVLSQTIPSKLENSNEKMAYWINVYNAFTLKVIVENYPVKSINDLHKGGRILGHIFSTTVWDEEFIIINGKELSLNDVEHKILRKDFDEPRIHFAIVCASISCPQLRREAFTKVNLEEQLQDQAVKFFNDNTKNKFDKKTRTAYLSKILDWFEEDFGENNKEVLLFVSEYLNDDLKRDIVENTDKWSIEYLDYDWGLNEHKIN